MKFLRSLRLRLTIVFSAVMVTLLFFIFGYLYLFLYQQIDEEAERLIADRFDMIEHIMSDDSSYTNLQDRLLVLKKRIEREWLNPIHEPIWIKIRDSSGQLIAETPHFDKLDLNNKYIIALNRNLQHATGAEQFLQVHVVIDRSKEHEKVYQYGERIFMLFLFSIFLFVVIAFRIIESELKPFVQMIATIKTLTAQSLHERVNSDKFPLEFEPLIESFNNMLDILQKSFEQISQFSADIAHELRTPLNAIMIKSEVLLDKRRSLEEYENLIESILIDTKELSKLVDILLFLARSENDSIHWQMKNLDLKNEIAEIVDFYEALASEKKIKLQFLIPEYVVMKGEKNLIRRAVSNLVQNAINYSPGGSQINIIYQETKEHHLIHVQDNGLGIAKEYQKFIFDRLYRVDSSRSSHSGGHGLGLAIVSSIMKVHQGKVVLQSELGKGSTFTLIFPKAS